MALVRRYTQETSENEIVIRKVVTTIDVSVDKDGNTVQTETTVTTVKDPKDLDPIDDL